MAHPDHDPDYLAELQDALEMYEAFHKLGMATEEELEYFRGIIQTQRDTPPQPWPHGKDIDEVIEDAVAEYRGMKQQEKETAQQKATQQKDQLRQNLTHETIANV